MSKRELLVADVVRRAVRNSYARLIAHEVELRGGDDDPESVHQARVATRRLRSDLQTFADFLDARWAAELRADLQWLGGELGSVRDVEVQRDRLRAHAERLPPTEAEAARRVIRRLDADRAAARADLLLTLGEPSYEQVRNKLAAAAASPAFTAAAREDATEALTAVVQRRWNHVRRAVRTMGDNPADETLHAIRIRAKRCRYAAEACESVFGKPARRLGRAMTRVQDVLGEHRDAVEAGVWLAKTAHECSPGEAYAIGMLAEIERECANAARAEFPLVWSRTDTKRIRGWL